MTAVGRPLREEWFERAEVDIERGVGPGCSALVPVQQDQQPGPDHHSEAGGQVTGACSIQDLIGGVVSSSSNPRPVRPSSTSLRVERLQLCVSPRCRAWTAADCRTGLSELNAGCCQRTGGAAPALRRKYEAIACLLL